MKYKLLIVLFFYIHMCAIARGDKPGGLRTKSVFVMEAQGVDYSYISSKDGHVTVYPNPTTDKLYIKGDGQVVYTIEIINMLGAVVLREETSNGVVSLASLEAGIYMLHVYGSDGQVYLVSKIIKQ